MAKVSFEVTQLPRPCSQQLLSNAETLAGKVINLTRVPTMGEWVDFHGIFYKVVKVWHIPIASLIDARIEVEYCQYENGNISSQVSK